MSDCRTAGHDRGRGGRRIGRRSEYRFIKFSYSTGQWSVIQDYGASNVVQWTPPVGESGAYALQVWVRESGLTSAYDAWQGLSFEVAPARTLIVVSQAGDPVGGGRGLTQSLPARVLQSNLNYLSVWAEDDRGEWFAVITNGQQGWQAGGTAIADDTENIGGFSLSLRHSANVYTVCGSSAGHVTIHEAALKPDGSLERAAIDFDQLCDGATGVLYGGLRLNSDVGLVHAQSVVPSSLTPTAGVRITLTANGSSATGPVDTGSWCWTSRPRNGRCCASTAASGSSTGRPRRPGSTLCSSGSGESAPRLATSPTSRVTRSSSGDRVLAARALATAGARTTYRATRM